jgi:hypothetical protein
MKTFWAILFSIGLTYIANIFDSIWLMIVVTAAWAAWDSTKIDLKKYKSGISYGPIILFFCVAGLWIIAFPWYLSMRYKIKNGLAQLKEGGNNTTMPQQMKNCPFCNEAIQNEAIKCRYCGEFVDSAKPIATPPKPIYFTERSKNIKGSEPESPAQSNTTKTPIQWGTHITIGLIIVSWFLYKAMNSNSSAPLAQTMSTQSVPNTNSPIAKDGSIITGETRWKILKATDEGGFLKSTNMFHGDQRGNGTKYIMIIAEVENLAKKPMTTWIAHLDIIDEQGREFAEFGDKVFFLPGEIKGNDMTPLNPGMRRTMATIYEVPEDARNFKIKLKDLGSSSTEVLIDLKLTSPNVSSSKHSKRKAVNSATDNGDGTVTLRTGDGADE